MLYTNYRDKSSQVRDRSLGERLILITLYTNTLRAALFEEEVVQYLPALSMPSLSNKIPHL